MDIILAPGVIQFSPGESPGSDQRGTSLNSLEWWLISVPCSTKRALSSKFIVLPSAATSTE